MTLRKLRNIPLPQMKFSKRRDAVPAELVRKILVEAGHRCAIPTCRSIPVEIAHIDPWSKSKENSFRNLIALCPTCHTLYDMGKIDRKAMLIYKSNLSSFSSEGRLIYNETEFELLSEFLVAPRPQWIVMPQGTRILVAKLIVEGLVGVGDIEFEDNRRERFADAFSLTWKGRLFLKANKNLVRSQAIKFESNENLLMRMRIN